jgi:glycolate oxidase iron-sulfur subunit
MNTRFTAHIDSCLTCRSCEAVCPNKVSFGQLIDGTRAMMESFPVDSAELRPARKKSRFRRWMERELIAQPSRIDELRSLARFYQKSGLQKWLRQSGLLGKAQLALLEAQLPDIGIPAGGGRSWRAVYPSEGKPRGEVGLYLGCVARLTDVETINAAIFVLNRLGYTVHVPQRQTCCGALHRHGGDQRVAGQLAHQNMGAFNELDLDGIISMASGCGSQLSEYSMTLPVSAPCDAQRVEGKLPLEAPDSSQARSFKAKVFDIGEFLAAAEGWDGVSITPLPHIVAVHEPCSLRNVLRASRHVYALLKRIPEVRIVPLMGNEQCCGAAGTYFLDQPEMAQALLRDKLDAVEASGARYIATSNIGCSMHIASGLRTEIHDAASEIEVLHPVTLLARQMGIIRL